MLQDFALPSLVGEFTIRKTGETVEVVASFQKEDGLRSEEDWVTYIDSTGKEHLRENLNLKLDFKLKTSEVFSKMLDFKTPSTNNQRAYEIVKRLVLDDNYCIEAAVEKAKTIIEAVNNNIE